MSGESSGKKRLLTINRLQQSTLVVVFAAIGSYLLVSSYAATFAVAAESEQGTVSSPAKLHADILASGGSAVAFGVTAAGPPSFSVAM